MLCYDYNYIILAIYGTYLNLTSVLLTVSCSVYSITVPGIQALWHSACSAHTASSVCGTVVSTGPIVSVVSLS